MGIFEMIDNTCLFLEVLHFANSAKRKVHSLQLVFEE
jgi:hypothetical protein